MPRPAKNPHPLKDLRKITGMNQPDFAELVGISVETLRSIETSRLPLSEEVAGRISWATGVRTVCDGEIFTLELKDWDGRPYTAESLKEWNRFSGEGDLQKKRQVALERLVTQINTAAHRVERGSQLYLTLLDQLKQFVEQLGLEAEIDDLLGSPLAIDFLLSEIRQHALPPPSGSSPVVLNYRRTFFSMQKQRDLSEVVEVPPEEVEEVFRVLAERQQAELQERQKKRLKRPPAK